MYYSNFFKKTYSFSKYNIFLLYGTHLYFWLLIRLVLVIDTITQWNYSCTLTVKKLQPAWIPVHMPDNAPIKQVSIKRNVSPYLSIALWSHTMGSEVKLNVFLILALDGNE
jgi:hypothetical protein